MTQEAFIQVKRETVEQWLDAMQQAHGDYHLMPNRVGPKEAFELVRKAITAAQKALAQPEQEPVAWIHNFIEGGISIGKQPSDLDRHPDRWTALYKDSKPCPTCEALCRTVMLDQTSHDTHPPQRTWVGLAKEDRLCAKYMQDAPDGIEAVIDYIEGKLKEKNCAG